LSWNPELKRYGIQKSVCIRNYNDENVGCTLLEFQLASVQSRTVARKFSIGRRYVSVGGLDVEN